MKTSDKLNVALQTFKIDQIQKEYLLDIIKDVLKLENQVKEKQQTDDWVVEYVFAYFDKVNQRCFPSKENVKRTPSRESAIRARLREGFTAEDFTKAINSRFHAWCSDSKMREYLTPETLFRAGNFAKYVEAAKGTRAPADWTNQTTQEHKSQNLFPA